MFGNIYRFVTIRGDPYGQKVTRSGKKGKKINKKIIRMKNGTRKWVVEVVSSQVVLLETVYYTGSMHGWSEICTTG